VTLIGGSLRYAALRICSSLPVLAGISVITFLLISVLPGNAAEQLLGLDATPDQISQFERTLGLDQPVSKRYFSWLVGMIQGEMGTSLASGQPVSRLILDRLPVTMALLIYSMVLVVSLSIPTALLAARWPGSLLDKAIRGICMLALSSANYVIAMLLVLVLALQLNLLPAFGYVPPGESAIGFLRSLTLPAIAIAIPLCSLHTRILRADLLDQLARSDYVLVARARGLGPWRILLTQTLRNSISGVVTLLGIHVSALLSGAVLLEQMFGLPGIGQLLFQAITLRDTIVVQAVVLLLAMGTVTTTILVDIAYTSIDPRIRYE
jgi:peptide/nickel transport system permease protein